MQRLLLLGLNHGTAPLAVRERIAFGAGQRLEAMDRFRRQFPEAEIVLLSTCNRVELYTARAVHGHPTPDQMADFLAGFHGLPASEFRPHLYHKADRDVATHLFTVASSLDSMVLGETQILGQVREAYETARAAGSAGSQLNPLFQRAVAVGKEVMTRTAIGEGRLSVASAAVDYAKNIFDRFADKTVLSIGAGKMAQLVLEHFADLSPKRLMVCNRDVEKARVLAGEFKGEAVTFDRLADHLAAADIVLTGTGSQHPIIHRPLMESVLKARRYRPIFLIDIALPRDVDEAVGDLDHVYLYNIDDLQQVVSATQSQRTGAVESARKLVAAAVDEFVAWQRTREMGPVIEQLFSRYHAVAQEELGRTLNKLPALSDQDRGQLEELARRIVNKILNDPVQTLRRADGLHLPAAQYLHAMQKLFRLEDAAGGSDPTNKPE